MNSPILNTLPADAGTHAGADSSMGALLLTSLGCTLLTSLLFMPALLRGFLSRGP